MPSTFNSPTIGSAYFYRRRAGQRIVCRSTGFELLYSLQVTLRTALEVLGLPFEQVAVIDLSNPTAGPGWDDATLRALYSYVGRTNRSYLPAIAADLLSHGQLSERTMKAAMWTLDSQGVDSSGNDIYGFGSPDEISFDAGTVFPMYEQIPPMPQNRTVEANAGGCTPIAEGEIAGDPVSTTTMLGVSPWLVLAVVAAGVWGISEATKAEPRKNPSSFGLGSIPINAGPYTVHSNRYGFESSHDDWHRAKTAAQASARTGSVVRIYVDNGIGGRNILAEYPASKKRASR